MEARGKAAGQLRYTGGGSVLLLVFFHQDLRPAFHSKRVGDSQSTVLPLPEQSGLLLQLTVVALRGKAAFPSHWKSMIQSTKKPGHGSSSG